MILMIFEKNWRENFNDVRMIQIKFFIFIIISRSPSIQFEIFLTEIDQKKGYQGKNFQKKLKKDEHL